MLYLRRIQSKTNQESLQNINKKSYLNKDPSYKVKEDVSCPPSIENAVYYCNKEFNDVLQLPEDSIISIYYCKFSSNRQTPITIIAKSVEHYATISNCNFETIFDVNIKFNAPKGTIENCYFKEGIVFSDPKSFIYYNYNPNGKDYTGKFSIKANTFEISIPITVLYFEYHEKSNLEFINNIIKVEEGFTECPLLDCDKEYGEIPWTFSGNTVPNLPSYKITSDKIKNSINFEVKDPNEENCPEDPGDYLNSQIYTYTCGNTFDISPGFDARNTILAIFYTTFTGIEISSKKIQRDR